MHRETEILKAGYRPVHERGPFSEGPQFASTYTAPGDPSANSLTYGRFHNPSWSALEAALGTLDGGHAVSFSSGMAATMAVFGTTLGPGDVLVLPSDCYYTVRVVADNWLRKMGVEIRLAPTRDNAQITQLDGARLVVLETPSNPQLDVCDIAAHVRAARERGVLVAVDNTTATGWLQQPLALGADFVIASDTKALTGHSDLVLGHVTTTSAERAETLRMWRTQHGAIPGPMEAWLAHRSIATLPLRLERQCASAQRLAEFLATDSLVRAVHYPGLTAHPGHAIARGQMRGFGGVVSFELATAAQANTFLQTLALVREATSFGSVHSTAERRARWGGDAIGEGFIRFSVGCEAVEDIIADVQQALRAAA